VLLAALIWHGNRFFLIEQRRHYDWFDHPWRKVSVLLFANVFWTAPLTATMVWAWYRLAGFAEPDLAAIRAVALVNVVCVIFVTHVYETVHLIRQREGDLLAVAQLQRARAEAELLALKAQVDPHFLFNSLNTLAHLIPHDPARALAFTGGLADTYRYILQNRERDLVPLEDELSFASGYFELLRLRFGEAVRLHVEGEAPGSLVPPISLQVAIENAVKHNAFDRERPLEVRVLLEPERAVVTNPLRPRALLGASARVGLPNLDERCRRVVGRGIEASPEGELFRVEVPLLRTSA
jgi:LytS/YehU family sensor histidine kinase